jgi:hypothetical protein
MKPHIAVEAFDAISQRLACLDAEVRSIRAMLFQLAEQQQSTAPQQVDFRSPEDFLTRPD